jgi:hypothetical protein
MSTKLTGEIEPVRAINPKVSEASSNLVAQMLRRKPSERPASYDELLRKIDALGKNEPLAHLGETATISLLEKPGATSSSPGAAASTSELGPQRLLRWLLPACVGVAAIAVLILAAASFFGPSPLSIRRDLSPSGKSLSLFNGKTFKDWQNRSGVWVPGKDDEGGSVLTGANGVAARKLPTLAGAAEPPKFYQIEFGFSFHKAEAVEVHFDIADYQEHCCVLRMTPVGSVLGYCDSDEGAFTPGRMTRPPQPFPKDASELHSVRLERQPAGWIARVDGKDIGTLPLYHSPELGEFRVRVEKGPAWFENFLLEELTVKQ